MKYLHLILRNLMRNRRRTLLTVFSIAVSLFIFSALVSMPTVANRVLADNASSLRIATHNKAGLAYFMPEAYKQQIAAVPHVVAVVAQSWYGGIYHEVNDQFPNLAIDADQVDVMWDDWGISKQAFADFKRIRTACLVGAGTMKRFNLRVGQQIQLKGSVYPFNVTLNIVGAMNDKAPPNFLLFRRDYLKEAAKAFGIPPFVSQFWVRVDRSENLPKVMAAIDVQFANSTAPTRSESEAAFVGSFLRGFRMFFRLAEILGVIVVVTIALVAANTAAMTIRERRAEIAVMRSIGFRSSTILALLLGESLLIGLAGGILGCGAAFAVLKAFSVGSPAMGLGNIQMPPMVLAETLVAAALIGLLSAWLPARSAARRNIVDALRLVA
jgi:putative ABC transport system permease protein